MPKSVSDAVDLNRTTVMHFDESRTMMDENRVTYLASYYFPKTYNNNHRSSVNGCHLKMLFIVYSKRTIIQ